jgi:hypothetical protein
MTSVALLTNQPKGTTMFAGQKTYITAAVAVIGAVAAYLTGSADLMDTVQLVVTAILGATIRHGVANA